MSLDTSKPKLLQLPKPPGQSKDAVDPPEGIRPWLRCHYCRAFATKDKPVKRCARCDKYRVQEDVFYCSKECQKKDWIATHQEICGATMQQYNSWLDAGFFLGGSHMTAERQRLKQWNYVYRRPILWAARQAFATNPTYAKCYYLLIECETVDSPNLRNCVLPCSISFKKIAENPTAIQCLKAGFTILHSRGDFVPATCCTRLAGVETFSVVPLCGQDYSLLEFATGMEAYLTPCPQWPWMVTLLASTGEQSAIAIDRLFTAMVSTMPDTKAQLGHLLDPFTSPELTNQLWKIPNQQEFSEIMSSFMNEWNREIETVSKFVQKPRRTATGLLLEAFANEYHRILMWAVRQAFRSNYIYIYIFNSEYRHTEYFLSIELKVMQKKIPYLQERPVPSEYWFGKLPILHEDWTAELVSTESQNGIENNIIPPTSNVVCQLHFYGEQATVLIPLGPCDQDFYFENFSEITKVPCSQWHFVFYFLACHGTQDVTILDRLLPQLLTLVAEASNQVGSQLQHMNTPQFGCERWVIEPHLLLRWMNLTDPWTEKWILTFQEPDTFSYPPAHTI